MILSDGDMSTLANMKLNLEANTSSVETDLQGTGPNKVIPIIMIFKLFGKEIKEKSEHHGLKK